MTRSTVERAHDVHECLNQLLKEWPDEEVFRFYIVLRIYAATFLVRASELCKAEDVPTLKALNENDTAFQEVAQASGHADWIKDFIERDGLN